ncbi:MAG: hypothetical protein HOP18_27990 [Deltaproteobacteria bacterium]|nr:hypothetical protein [Deltaproteobacteria bacterium]
MGYGRFVLLLMFGAIVMGSAPLDAQEQDLSRPDEPHSLVPQPPGLTHGMEQYYLGRHHKTAVFSGRLVCLRCDVMPTAENVEVCRKEGHRHALAMVGDAMVHPLLFTNPDLATRINAHEWHRKTVQVWGRYYADTGIIVVGDLKTAEE